MNTNIHLTKLRHAKATLCNSISNFCKYHKQIRIREKVFSLKKIISLKYSGVRSCFKDLLERDTIVQSEFVFDGWFKNYNFFSFKIACMCYCPAVVEGQFRLPYNSTNVWPSVKKSLP